MSSDLWTVFERAARKLGHKEAAVIRRSSKDEGREAFSYRQLWERSGRLARGLTACKQGERIALLSSNRQEWLEVMLACARLGLISVPLDIGQNPETVSYILKETEPKRIFVEDSLLKKIDESWHKQTIVIGEHKKLITYKDLLLTQRLVPQRRYVGPQDILSILYTSGTTREPRGVPQTHEGFLGVTCPAAISRLRLRRREIILSVGPWFHVMGQLLLWTSFLLGAKTVYVPPVPSVLKDLLLIAGQEKATVLLGPPKLYNAMLQRIEAGIKEKGRVVNWLFDNAPWVVGRLIRHQYGLKFRFLVSGSAKLNTTTYSGFKRLGSGWEPHEGIGMSEDQSLSHIPPLGKTEKGSVGLLIPGMQRRITEFFVDEEGNPQSTEEPVEPGAWGELCLKGHNVLPRGYWRRPELTNKLVDKDSWFHTGDEARELPNGYLEVRGRLGEVGVLASGKNISLVKIEQTVELSSWVDWAVAKVIKGKLYVMVFPTAEFAKRMKRENQFSMFQILWQDIKELNSRLATPEQVAKARVFVATTKPPLTSTGKIKRGEVKWPEID